MSHLSPVTTTSEALGQAGQRAGLHLVLAEADQCRVGTRASLIILSSNCEVKRGYNSVRTTARTSPR